MPPRRKRIAIVPPSDSDSSDSDATVKRSNPEHSTQQNSVRTTARKSTGALRRQAANSTALSDKPITTESTIDRLLKRRTAKDSTGTRTRVLEDETNPEIESQPEASPSQNVRKTARKSTATRNVCTSEIDDTRNESMPRSSATQSSPRSTARKSTGGQLSPEKGRDSRNEAMLSRTRASKEKSSRNLRASTAFARDDSGDSDFEEIPQGRSSRRQNSTMNQQASTSAACSAATLMESPSSDSDKTDIIISTAVRSSPRTRAKTNNARGRQATSSRNSVINAQASTSNRRSTSESEEEESDAFDDNNSRRRSLRRTSQRTANQSAQYEENVSDYSPETPDSDDDVLVYDRHSANLKNAAARSKRPQARSRKKHSSSDLYDEEDYSPSTSKKQARQTKASASVKSSTVGEKIDTVDASTLRNLAQKCVYYLLIEDQKKYAIKRKSIISNVFKDQSLSPKVYHAVLLEVNNILKDTYGLEIVKVEKQKDSYIILNDLDRDLGMEDFIELSRQKQEHYGFVLYLLTIIFMNGNSITETELWKALKPFGIDPSSQKLHPVFGDVKKYITVELVKQMYLECRTLNTDTGEREFVWGVRANSEIDKRDLLAYACEVMDISNPEQFVLQYKDAQESAKENMNNGRQ